MQLKGEDVDGDALTYILLTKPLLGELSGTAPDLVYQPHANVNGLDEFTFGGI